MSTATRQPRSSGRPGRTYRAATVAAATVLLVAGLGTVPEPPDAAAAPLPEGAETFLASRTDEGSSTQPYLTPGGQQVAFVSSVDGLAPDDTNGVGDVLLATAAGGPDDPFSGAPVLVSRPDAALGQTQADGPSSEPVASADGRYVAFVSAATNLVADPSTGERSHVFVRDVTAGTTFRVDAGTEPDGVSSGPDLSDDGRYLVFTSEATNLFPGDTNDAPDAFLADLDSDGDGTLGDVTVTRFAPAVSVEGGTFDPVISGNGDRVAFTAGGEISGTLAGARGGGRGHGPGPGHGYPYPDPEPPETHVYSGDRADAADSAQHVAAAAGQPTIDATGAVVAFVLDVTADVCPLPGPRVVAWAQADGALVSLGWNLVDLDAGVNDAPFVSADGSTVAWQTTQPPFDFSGPADPLPAPVVRTERIAWSDARVGALPCSGISSFDWYDVAEGTAPTLSASGRTVALSGPPPTALGAADASVLVVDTHSHEGLAVASTASSLLDRGFMTEVDIAALPPTQVRRYASALADAPIHRLPIHRLPIHRLPIHRLPIHRLLVDPAPIHRLPIHRLPIHRLPIHRLDVPGGWTELLAGTPFAGELVQSVTLDEVLAWVETTLADPAAPAAERAAADRIRSLTLADVDLSASGVDGLSLASFVLGRAPLAAVPLPGAGTPTERWQALLDGQGVALRVDPASVLAELDSAGLDVGRSGVEGVPLRDLPVDDTLLGELLLAGLFLPGTPLGEVEVSALDERARTALFGPNPPSGTLAGTTGSLLATATAADLARGAPAGVTLGTLLFSVLDAGSYPWEQIGTDAILPEAFRATTAATCAGGRCAPQAAFAFTVDAGPGEDPVFAAPTAQITLPAGTHAQGAVQARGSGPGMTWRAGEPYTGPVQQGAGRVTLPLQDTPSGTSLTVAVDYSATTKGPGDAASTGLLTSGDLRADERVFSTVALPDFDDPTRNRTDGQWELGTPPAVMQEGRLYYEWISPLYLRLNDSGEREVGPAADEDYYLVDPPAPGSRLVISTNAADGQIELGLYAPTAGVPVGVDSAGPAPGVPVTEPGGPYGAVTESGGDVGVELDGHALVDQAVARGGGAAQLEAASADVAAQEPLLVRVASGNGSASSALYSLRVRYVEEPAEQACTPWAPAQTADPGVVGTSAPVTPGTNTVYLVDTQRFGDTHGAAAAADVRASLERLTGVGDVRGAVLSVDSDASVRAARSALDANPCSMSARRQLAAAINTYVATALGDQRDAITSLVLVGGDDILPFVPVPQRTAQFNEASHATSLRLTRTPDGQACPAVATGAPDPCATPLSAAAATNHVLTDDPYGLASAYESLGGFLYVPTVAVGRLVETPGQILGAVDRFVASDGVLQASSTLTAGYGAWAELPGLVTQELAWRAPAQQPLAQPWTREDVLTRLLPAGGTSPRVVSVNTHADETRMLPGVAGAENGQFRDADLLTAATVASTAGPALAGALVFQIGCHAGSNLPGAYYGDVPDWADVFSGAGGYVGNTGYGLANSVTTALSERLLASYATWVGAQANGTPVSAAGALTYAKQSYLGGLGLYSGYDEKVLMQTVYYGLPMYSFAQPGKDLPLPAVPADLTPVQVGPGGIAAASLTLDPVFETHTVVDENGRTVSFLTADGQDPLVVAGQPILPRVVSRLAPDPDGRVPRGAVLTGFTSSRTDGVVPAIGDPTLGIPGSVGRQAGAAFPARFATVTSQDTPVGRVDLLVVTPGRAETQPDGSGYLEQFSDLTIDVTYGDPDADDVTEPLFTHVDVQGSSFRVGVDGTGSDAVRVVLLVQQQGSSAWERSELVRDPGSGDWVGDAAAVGPFRWIVQAVDAAGNVGIESTRGHLVVAGAAPPTLTDPGTDAVVRVGERLVRTVEVADGDLTERLTGRYTIAEDGQTVGGGQLTILPGGDGVVRAVLDRVVTAPGVFTVTMEVCRSTSCSVVQFALEVLANGAPSATVSISSDTAAVTPTSVLTALAEGTDPDGDAVTLTYEWRRNGIPVDGASSPTLDLDGLAEVDDVVSVIVTPHDGLSPGPAATAQAVVGAAPDPGGPTITVEARSKGRPYAEGDWSRHPVHLRFTCSSDVRVVSCTRPVNVTKDTGPDGRVVTGTVRDATGRTATVSFVVRVDRKPPVLAPVVTPDPVVVGGAAVATPNATDAGSGVATQSCAVPDTRKKGKHKVTCTATDVAGNTAKAKADYRVVPR